jgi:hypothetical protein
LRDDSVAVVALNECVGFLTGYESLRLVAAPDEATLTADDLSIAALVRDWESELVALRRRARLQLVRAELKVLSSPTGLRRADIA